MFRKDARVICGNLSHLLGEMFGVDFTTDERVVVVVSQEYVVLELEFCFVVGTLAFGSAELEDFSFVVIGAALRDCLF